MESAFLGSGAVISLGEGRFFAGWGARRWLDQPKEGAFFFPDFFLKEEPHWFCHEESAVLGADQLISLLPVIEPRAALKWQLTQEEHFCAAFSKLQQLFEQKMLTKAVPYLFAEPVGKSSPFIVSTVLRQLLAQCAQFPLFLYGFWDEKGGMIGATPEQLFQAKGGRLQTIACAATVLQENVDSLLLDRKMVHEQQIVAKQLEEELTPFGRVTVGQKAPRVVGKLAHLVTPIEVELSEGVDFEKLVKMLHPTAALGAVPREVGSEWLQRYAERIPRGRFGAPAGCLLEKESCCLVAIRGVQWEGKKQRIGLGCGVVAESELEKEMAELQLKLSAICEAMKI